MCLLWVQRFEAFKFQTVYVRKWLITKYLHMTMKHYQGSLLKKCFLETQSQIVKTSLLSTIWIYGSWLQAMSNNQPVRVEFKKYLKQFPTKGTSWQRLTKSNGLGFFPNILESLRNVKHFSLLQISKFNMMSKLKFI